jgi:citrate lyase subunit alpha/citrate CoA-transferase
VNTITTPGETVDVVVTEQGVAVNPRRDELAQRLREAGIALAGIDELCRRAARNAPAAGPKPRHRDRIVGIVEYRDGTVIDTLGAVGGR